MKRVAIVADSHFDEHSRFEECIRIHAWIAEQCAERGVHLVLHSGDVYERKSTPRERQAVAQWVQQITRQAPMVIVRGNHDALGDLPLLERLQTAHPVFVVEGAGVIPIKTAGVTVGCLGWPNKSRVLTLPGATSHEAGEQLAGEALRNVLRGLGQQMAEHTGPRILLAHAMVRGSRVSTGQPLVGCDLEVGLDGLRLADAHLYALGHIHFGQAWSHDGCDENPVTATHCDAVYPGSPRRTSYGEREDKHFVIATFEGEDLVGVEYVKTPCAPMVHMEAHWVAEHIALPGDVVVPAGFVYSDESYVNTPVPGADIRLRYHVEPEYRDAARAAAGALRDRMLADGAVAVKVEEVVEAASTARAPEVASATTLADKLRAYWRVRDNEPEPTRADSLIVKATELETEHHAL